MPTPQRIQGNGSCSRKVRDNSLVLTPWSWAWPSLLSLPSADEFRLGVSVTQLQPCHPTKTRKEQTAAHQGRSPDYQLLPPLACGSPTSQLENWELVDSHVAPHTALQWLPKGRACNDKGGSLRWTLLGGRAAKKLQLVQQQFFSSAAYSATRGV